MFADAVPTPYVMMAATDSRYFTAICPRVYRFTPFEMTRKQRESIHANDEHITVDAYRKLHPDHVIVSYINTSVEVKAEWRWAVIAVAGWSPPIRGNTPVPNLGLIL